MENNTTNTPSYPQATHLDLFAHELEYDDIYARIARARRLESHDIGLATLLTLIHILGKIEIIARK